MNSKTEEEVRKRRGRGRSSPLNIYQKMLFFMGALALFLATGTSLTIPLLVSVGAIGVTLLIFSLFKSRKRKREEGKKADLKEIFPETEEKAVAQQEILAEEQEKVVGRQDIFTEEKEKMVELQDSGPDGKGVDEQEILIDQKEKSLTNRTGLLKFGKN